MNLLVSYTEFGKDIKLAPIAQQTNVSNFFKKPIGGKNLANDDAEVDDKELIW